MRINSLLSTEQRSAKSGFNSSATKLKRSIKLYRNQKCEKGKFICIQITNLQLNVELRCNMKLATKNNRP